RRRGGTVLYEHQLGVAARVLGDGGEVGGHLGERGDGDGDDLEVGGGGEVDLVYERRVVRSRLPGGDRGGRGVVGWGREQHVRSSPARGVRSEGRARRAVGMVVTG